MKYNTQVCRGRRVIKKEYNNKQHTAREMFRQQQPEKPMSFSLFSPLHIIDTFSPFILFWE
jgi:hypothetical protein